MKYPIGMSKRTITVIHSDISQKAGAQPVVVAVNDEWFEVDLTTQEAKEPKDALNRWRAAGRAVAPPPSYRRKVKVPVTTAQERLEIRAWAAQEGRDLSDRGRIPADVVLAYEKAHNRRFLIR